MTGFPALEATTGLIAGLLLGVIYFALLYRAVRLHAAAVPAGTVITLHLLRAALAVGSFWLLAQLGAWPLLAGLAGFLMVRALARRRVGGP
jgi:F1F0 ATPase subunit 2